MVNVFSICIYGEYNPKYHVGLLENIEMARKYYPDWFVYVYAGADTTDEYISALQAYSNVRVFRTGKLGASNMIERFFALENPEVDVMFVRDADSRIHWKDRWAISEFLKTNSVLHLIRDHDQHTSPMLGGLWGLRRSAGVSIRELYNNYKEDTSMGWRYAHDQNFLNDEVYPRLRGRSLAHYSNGRHMRHDFSVEFPFRWSDSLYCGKVEVPMGFRDLVSPDAVPTKRAEPVVNYNLPKALTKMNL